MPAKYWSFSLSVNPNVACASMSCNTAWHELRDLSSISQCMDQTWSYQALYVVNWLCSVSW